MTRVERTGWRDEALSLRHRVWGEDAPGVDIDWLFLEYDRAQPVALIDYKESGSPRVIPNDASAMALGRLGDRASVPTFVVRYRVASTGLYEFAVLPINETSRGLLPSFKRLGELEYVEWLYRLRGRDVPSVVKNNIAAAAREWLAA